MRSKAHAIWDIDPESGLGGFGDPNDDYTVKTGALNITLAYPIIHKLRRRYMPILDLENVTKIPANSTFSQEEVDSLLAQPEGNFTAFHASAERDLAGGCPEGSSNTTACPIEGAPTFSPNENIDRFWWMWQEKSDLNKAAFHGDRFRICPIWLHTLMVNPRG
ncbi:Di-copper centre-containing protein [Rhizoctonia solani]|uniref:Di-copper centre-containing protein n=1 Tax=Rhizoctonia solani TaxID=456999 RepID=A0A8H7I5E2_9AGAM|nr:Di-copper centre-containing protein [Rhizoctonia solani]